MGIRESASPRSVGSVQNIGALGLRHSGDAVDAQLVIGVSPAVGLLVPVALPPPTLETIPGRSCSRRSKLRPFKGSALIDSVADRPAQGCVGGVDRRDLSGDRDRLGLLARLNTMSTRMF